MAGFIPEKTAKHFIGTVDNIYTPLQQRRLVYLHGDIDLQFNNLKNQNQNPMETEKSDISS